MKWKTQNSCSSHHQPAIVLFQLLTIINHRLTIDIPSHGWLLTMINHYYIVIVFPRILACFSSNLHRFPGSPPWSTARSPPAQQRRPPARPRMSVPPNIHRRGSRFIGSRPGKRLQKAIENGHLQLIYQLNMVIFHSYVNVYLRATPNFWTQKNAENLFKFSLFFGLGVIGCFFCTFLGDCYHT